MSRSARRFVRTILVGTFALGALVWLAVEQFGVARRDMLELLLATGAVVLMIIVAAAGVTALWIGLRKFWRDS